MPVDFLFEIGLEEVPARMLAGAQAELLKRVVGLLRRESLLSKDAEEAAKSFSTPRRLGVFVRGVLSTQNDSYAKVLGPAAKIAFKDGQPTAAAESFARKNGVSVDQLKIETTPKGDYVSAETMHKGRPAAEVIAAELPKELAAIYWAKNMYWRPGKPERFVRPVRWLVGLLGAEIVPIEFGGYTAKRATFGHRVLFGPTPIEIGEPAEYLASLTNAFVMPDVELRRHTIRKALDRVCRSAADTRWREDHTLVDKMTHMTEWPSVILGSFDPAYLTLPEEVLVTVMRDHQNYFAVEDSAGKLAPHFLAVLNTVAEEKGEAVIRHGNERVLRARFNDARFFWEFDQRIPLEDRVLLLEKVTFQKDLGSYAAKSERVQRLSGMLAGLLTVLGEGVDTKALHDAARLAKTDLTTDLVKEFTELQGQIGGLYARAQGASAKTADAIYDHYLPASMDDAIPRTIEGQLLALADKADTIAGMFSLGLEPTGSKDPFALRRAANGIVKILAESQLKLTLGEIAFAAAPGNETVVARMELFFAERVEFYLREAKQQAYDVVAAVLGAGADDVRDAIARAQAITIVRGSEDFAAVSAAMKRIKNILDQATQKGIAFEVVPDQFSIPGSAEQALLTRAVEVQQTIATKNETKDYVGILETIATLRPDLDLFFDSVMVMDPDEQVRRRRLTILNWIQHSFSWFADFSEIVVPG